MYNRYINIKKDFSKQNEHANLIEPAIRNAKFESEEDPRLSFSFGGTQQTGRAGTPVPLVYGEIFTGSVVISGGIDTEQVQA